MVNSKSKTIRNRT